MKQRILAILAVALAVLVLVSLAQIRQLQQEITRLQDQLYRQEDNLDHRLSGIEQRVDNKISEMLQEQQKVFSTAQYSYGTVYPETMEVEVCFRAVPRDFSPETSTVELSFDGKTVPLRLEEGAYTGSTRMDLRREAVATELRLCTGDAVQVEPLDWHLLPRYEVLPNMNVSFSGVSGQDFGKKSNFFVDLCTEIDVYANAEQVRSAELVVEYDGEELRRYPIDLSREAQEAYRAQEVPDRTLSETAEPMPDESDRVIYYYLKESFEIDPGSSIVIFAEIEDRYGLRYRGYVTSYALDASGEADGDRIHDLEAEYGEPRLLP